MMIQQQMVVNAHTAQMNNNTGNNNGSWNANANNNSGGWPKKQGKKKKGNQAWTGYSGNSNSGAWSPICGVAQTT